MGTPIRTCVACRQQRPQDELIRVTWDGETLTANPPGARRGPGRGAYVCGDQACVAASVRGPLDRALRTNGAHAAGLTERLLELLGVSEHRS